jgi:hypothetical protein
MSKIKPLHPIFFIIIGIVLALGSSALTPPINLWEQVLPTSTPTPAMPTPTVTPTPEVELVPGGTNIILLLGALLVVIVVIAIIWHRRDWEK